MEFLLIIILTAIIASIVQANVEKLNKPVEDKLVIQKKKCPPHQWFWQDIVDQDGNKHGERIVCKVCGPLSNSLSKQGE